MRAHQRIGWNDKCVILSTWNVHFARDKIIGRLLLIPFFAQFSIHLLIFGRNYATFELASATFIYAQLNNFAKKLAEFTISFMRNCSKWHDNLFPRETQYSLYVIKTTIPIFVNLNIPRNYVVHYL